MSLHSQQPFGANHKIENWSFANAAARLANGLYATTNIGQVAYQQDNTSYWRLSSVANPGAAATPTWVPVGSTVGNVIENFIDCTSLSGVELTSLKNKDIIELPIRYLVAVTFNDSTAIYRLKANAPDATLGDVAVASDANKCWRKTLGL